jgi:glyoxylase-like metal-dependent hydrolase (beta-lactamase superfamily II)
MYRLSSLYGNTQKLDGGAMFGNVPKSIWTKWINADTDNRINLSCRCLLIQGGENKRNILLETGVGAFFEPGLKKRYGVSEDKHVLLEELARKGLSHEDIHYIIISHLHFDHAGGLLSAWSQDIATRLLFPNAQFIVSQVAWQRANEPHPRDRASFIPLLNELLAKSNRLNIVNEEFCELLGDDFRFFYSNGHTPGMLMTEVNMPAGPILFVADLIPGTSWLHLPVTMGYDRFPEEVINEKKKIVEYLIKRNGRIFYTHDPSVAMSRIKFDGEGRCIPYETTEAIDNLTD